MRLNWGRQTVQPGSPSISVFGILKPRPKPLSWAKIQFPPGPPRQDRACGMCNICQMCRTWPKSIQLFGPSHRSPALRPYSPCPRGDVNKRPNEENNKPKNFSCPSKSQCPKNIIIRNKYLIQKKMYTTSGTITPFMFICLCSKPC